MLARATILAADSQRLVRWSARWCKFIFISMLFPSFFFLSLSHSFPLPLPRLPLPYRLSRRRLKDASYHAVLSSIKEQLYRRYTSKPKLECNEAKKQEGNVTETPKEEEQHSKANEQVKARLNNKKAKLAIADAADEFVRISLAQHGTAQHGAPWRSTSQQQKIIAPLLLPQILYI